MRRVGQSAIQSPTSMAPRRHFSTNSLPLAIHNVEVTVYPQNASISRTTTSLVNNRYRSLNRRELSAF
jgi:hypothetical protein